MNIMYVSALEGGEYSGPLHSVPKQIHAQSTYDNVYWINLTNINAIICNNNEYHYINIKDFKIANLPEPFNKPDLVVFEEFFKVECCLLARKVEKLKIPYVIIPRCQMTEKYLLNKRLKKIIARVLLFNHFAKKAAAVQFLSIQEQKDSEMFYTGRSHIVANGIDIPKNLNKQNNNRKKIGVFIGRYSIWQKGLDLLIESISLLKKELISNNISFVLYGPNERTGTSSEIDDLVKKYDVREIVNVNGPIFGREKEQVLKNADFFVHTSRFEGMPMSVLEALSYGLPCLLTQGSNLREKIEEYNAGWGVDDNVQSIVNGISQLLDEIKNDNEKSFNALKLAQAYSWDSIALESHNYYESIVHNN